MWGRGTATCLRPSNNRQTTAGFIHAGTFFPNMPAVVTEALGLMFNAMPLKSIDFYASLPSGWWGVSVQIAGTGGLGQLLGAFSFVLQEAGFPSSELAASPLLCRAALCRAVCAVECACPPCHLDVGLSPGPPFSASVCCSELFPATLLHRRQADRQRPACRDR